MKLKEFLKGRGVKQHAVCILLYALYIFVFLVLMEKFPNHTDMVIGGTTLLFIPVSIWMFSLLFIDIAVIGKWLCRLIVPEKWRMAVARFFEPKRRPGGGIYVAPNGSGPDHAEDKIFSMWEDAIIWKDGGLYYRKNGEYRLITVEQARDLERGYHRYQMSMDVNRGGLPDEVAQKTRGFDSEGNYVGGYAVDQFWMRRFGHIESAQPEETPKPKAADEPAAEDPQSAAEPKKNSQDEQEIFRMWDDAVVWKDGLLQLRKNGEYAPITLEQAREQERRYHAYQMNMDVQRGGAPLELARENRGFDQNGNFVRGYAVDRFWTKRFGYVPDDPQVTMIRCARCGEFVKKNELTVCEGAAYCAGCAVRLKIGDRTPESGKKPETPKKPKTVMRCTCCRLLLKPGEAVIRNQEPYCKKCGDMPDREKDQPVLETPQWSIVWNEGKLYAYSKYGGYRRIQLYKAREMEREHMQGMWQTCLERGMMTEEQANETYKIKKGKYVGAYAVDALLDGRIGMRICDLNLETLFWKDGGLYCLKLTGEYVPITVDEARKMEFDYWNNTAAWAYRAGEVKLFEEAQSRLKETKDGFRLKEYAVDEFLRKRQAAGARGEEADDQPGTKICEVYQGELIWKDGGLHYQKYQGECTPVTLEEAQKLERSYWSYDSDHIYRMGASMEHVQQVLGFDEDGNRTSTYAVDEFMKRRAEAVCTRCGARHYAPLEDLIAPDFGCKTCGSPVRISKVAKKVCMADIVADGLIYRKVRADMVLIGVEIGAKAAVVHSSIDGHPLVRVDEHAFDERETDLKLTFEPGFRMEVKWDNYTPDTKVRFLPRLPGFTGERVMEIGNYHGPDLVREYLYYSDDHSQTVRERFEYHGFDAVYTVELV